MGTDHTHAGLPFTYGTAEIGAVQPTCRAISLDELTAGGSITVLAASPEDIEDGVAGLVTASLAKGQHVSLLTLDERPDGSRSPDRALTSPMNNGPMNGGPRRLSEVALYRPDGMTRPEDVGRAAARVLEDLMRCRAKTLFVAAVPVSSAPHRFLDLVARRVVASRPDASCWYFAAKRDAFPAKPHRLRSNAVVRTFDTRGWNERRTRQRPELFWRLKDVNALSSVSAYDEQHA